MSTRSVCSGTPWRSSKVTSDGRCAALTSANAGSACDGEARAAEHEGDDGPSRNALHGPTSIGAFGVSPKRSGAYIASTRVGGRANRPGLLRRMLYSTTCLPRGRYS